MGDPDTNTDGSKRGRTRKNAVKTASVFAVVITESDRPDGQFLATRTIRRLQNTEDWARQSFDACCKTLRGTVQGTVNAVKLHVTHRRNENVIGMESR